ncbi:MAG: D-alanyl-D-alanine carboxypeptidase/D-alanyl-D-alanine-endopeptidase [bacterium]|nr:D-alanyl-D-alanine carboxypeptidase/D-alanyl-D-alanine-endopeptidase [bacterium]
MKSAVALISAWCVLGFCAGVSAGTVAEFAAFADSVLLEPALAGASWSMQVYSLSGDSVVFERDADRLLTPASVTKLFTSAAALDALGSDFRFTTAVAADGAVDEDSVLEGDLIVLAGGDPTIETKSVDSLGGPVLRTWADSLLAHGIRRVSGDIVLRTWPYRLESALESWEVADVNAGFAPPVDGFGFNSNVCHMQVLPASALGDSARFVLDPPFAPVHLKPRVATVPAQSGCWLDLQVAPADTTAVIAGEMPLDEDGEFLWISVQDPARYFGFALKNALEKRGIATDGGVVVDRSVPNGGAPLRELFVHSSPPLPDVLALMNKESDNFSGEHVLRALGLAAGGVPDRRAGLDAVSRFAARSGIDKSTLHLEDGCGLSRQNLVSARAAVKLLRAIYASPERDVFLSSLAVSGTDGTLAYRLNAPQVVGRVHGKTGTMTQVSNIAGYVQTERGESFAFAILCDHFSNSIHRVRTAQDRLLERLVTDPPR